MKQEYIWIAILTAAAVSLVVRALPLTLIRRKIENRFIRSFLFYVPYVTLAGCFRSRSLPAWWNTWRV